MSTRPIIGITGRAGAGKDTLAKMIKKEIDRHFWVDSRITSLAEPLKKIAGEVFGFTTAQLYGPSEERNKPDPRWARDDGRGPLTPREALQTLGTEWGRALHPDVWIRKLIDTHARMGDVVTIVPDVRFDNEARAIQNFGGVVIRVDRPGAASALTGEAATHASEAGVSLDLLNATVANDGDLRKLADAARGIVAKLAKDLKRRR